MPAPSADFIRSMLQPYQPYGSSGAIALAGLQENRNQRREGARQFDVEDARKKQYYGFQREQWEAGRSDEERDKQIKAFTAFQAALDSGDMEQAALAANTLRAYGVDVQEYDGAAAGAPGAPTGGGSPALPEEAPQTPESYDPGNTYGSTPMDAMARQSPTAAIAQSRARAQAAPPAPPAPDYNPEADADEQQADALIKQWETEPASDPAEEAARQEFIFNANEAKARREAPKPPVESTGSEETGAADFEAPPVGPRPEPARETVPEQPGQPEQTGQKMPPMRGYRLNFGGKFINIDGQAIADRQRSRVQGVLGPLLVSASSPEEKEAAQEATDIATNAVGLYSPEEAVQLGLKHYTIKMDLAAREQRARIGAAGQAARGGVASGNKFELARTSGLTDDVENMVKGVEQNWGVKNLREASAASDKTVDLLSTQNPLAQRAALTATLKQWFSSVTSNTELAMVLGGGGFIEQMKLEIGKYLDEGRLPEKYVRWLKEASVKAAAWSRKRIADAAETARRTILENPGFTERFTKPGEGQRYADYVWGRITGTRIKRKPAGAAAPAKPAGKKGAPRTNVQAEADELAR